MLEEPSDVAAGKADIMSQSEGVERCSSIWSVKANDLWQLMRDNGFKTGDLHALKQSS